MEKGFCFPQMPFAKGHLQRSPEAKPLAGLGRAQEKIINFLIPYRKAAEIMLYFNNTDKTKCICGC